MVTYGRFNRIRSCLVAYPPGVLTHREFGGQRYDPLAHSLMSTQLWGPRFLQPRRQIQWYDPTVLTHVDCTGQEFGTSTHSFTSLHVGKRASLGTGYHPLLQTHFQLPGVLTQVEFGSQPWIPRLHSFMSRHWNSEIFSQPLWQTQ